MTLEITNDNQKIIVYQWMSSEFSNYLYAALVHFQTDERIKDKHRLMFNNMTDEEKESIHLMESIGEMILLDGEDQ